MGERERGGEEEEEGEDGEDGAGAGLMRSGGESIELEREDLVELGSRCNFRRRSVIPSRPNLSWPSRPMEVLRSSLLAAMEPLCLSMEWSISSTSSASDSRGRVAGWIEDRAAGSRAGVEEEEGEGIESFLDGWEA